MTIDPSGPEFAINRLAYAPTVDAMRAVWRTLLPEQREHPDVIAYAKEQAERLEKEGAE